MVKQRAIDFLVYLAVRLAVAVLQAVPMRRLVRLADPVAWLMSDVLKMRRKVLDDNLRHAFPDLDDAARQELKRRHWRYLFIMVCEITHAPRKLHETNWRSHIRLENARPLVAALLDDRPTVVVSGHYGNFEIAGSTIGLLGFRSFSIARPLDNPYVDRFMNQFRTRTRRVVLPKKGSAGEVAERLAANEILTVLGDQSAGPRGCWVEFFNRPASAHKAIAVFSLLNDGPMVVCYGRQLEGSSSGGPMQFEIGTAAVADPRHDAPHTGGVRELTQWYTDQLAAIVRVAPEQYWWVHNRWKGADKQSLKKVRRRRASAA